MSADEMRAAARRVVDEMPPLTTDQIEKVARFVRGGRGE